jgi:hypothetical protein
MANAAGLGDLCAPLDDRNPFSDRMRGESATTPILIN